MIKLIAVVLLLVSLQLNAKTPTFQVYSIGNKRVNVQVENITGKTTVYVLDRNGESIYKIGKNKDENLNVTLDLGELTHGDYKLVYEDDFARRAIPMELMDDTVIVRKDDAEKIYFPQVSKEDNAMLIKLLSNDGNDLSIDIQNTYGDTLFEENIEGRIGLIGKRFEFKPGDYTVTIKSKNFIQTQYLTFK